MSMSEKEFKDRDEQAVWELIGRHKGIEPSFGFTERTLRRLNEKPEPAPSVFWRPLLRWAMLATVVAMIGRGFWMTRSHTSQQIGEREANVYAGSQGSDYLEDFDVIASLDQLNGEGKL
jgi:hypothetical protein